MQIYYSLFLRANFFQKYNFPFFFLFFSPKTNISSNDYASLKGKPVYIRSKLITGNNRSNITLRKEMALMIFIVFCLLRKKSN